MGSCNRRQIHGLLGADGSKSVEGVRVRLNGASAPSGYLRVGRASRVPGINFKGNDLVTHLNAPYPLTQKDRKCVAVIVLQPVQQGPTTQPP